MREIKFRAWQRIGTPHMVPWKHHLQNFTFKEFNSGYYEFMQYTGLKDRKGKEIYESDIVAWNTGEKFVVRWFAPHAKFLYRCIKKGYGIDNDAGSHEVEVIGNIYEHSHLLEKAES